MEDFSFPAVQTDHDSACNLPFPHFAASPLWFLSSVSNEKATCRKSFSSVEEATKVADTLGVSSLSDDEDARRQLVSKEEKMDMLWEDFNDELYRVSCEWKKKDGKGKSSSVRVSDQAFGMMPKDGRSLLPRKRPSLVVMLKVLKKMFLVQKKRTSKRASIYNMQVGT